MATRITSQAEPLPGYRLVERLGRGGYGEVWKAEAPGGLFKAIKFVYGDLEGAGDDNKGAEQELKALHRVKSIRHPFILSIERFDIIEGQLMIVMELADRNLWDRFQECRSQGLVGIPRDELLGYMDETCEALDLMNTNYQIQHLDIKPQNLFLVHNHIKVADFGLAKDFEGIRATVTGGVTPVYAAPETFEGWISRFCDQYSLAIVYQELLTGVRPFSGTNTRQLLLQHISAVPDVSSLPPNEREIVARSLSKKPDERFPTCTDFVKALRASSNAPVAVNAKPAVLRPEIAPSDTAQTVPNKKAGKGNDLVPPPQTPVGPHHTMRPPVVLKGLPKLVTPGTPAATTPRPPANPAHSTPPSNVTLQRPAAHETNCVARLGVAPLEKIGSGALVPVYVVGIGHSGLHVLQRLRSYLHERFGRATFPHWKWLFIDTDASTIQSAQTASKHMTFDQSEVFHARLHRP
ncbi:MAG: protein kinase, partial [Planctomycetes bacterium]|nr:protein kinase [Planctomycetota bacterium]